MIDSLIRACPLFAEGKCPQQQQIEKLYLFPNYLQSRTLRKFAEANAAPRKPFPLITLRRFLHILDNPDI